MAKYGEGFFTSLGFAPLPKTFWERSLFTKPRDRDVVCHASAWDVDSKDDLRIKMCIQITEEDFRGFITNWATIFTSARMTSSRRCFRTAPTMASTKRSATPSRFRSRRST